MENNISKKNWQRNEMDKPKHLPSDKKNRR